MGEISHESIRRPLTAGKTIFDYADELALRVPTSCGRTGDCHECIVEIKRGMDIFLVQLTDVLKEYSKPIETKEAKTNIQ